MAELGLLGDHQGDEEPALRRRAPPEGRGEHGGAPGGWAAPEDHERVLRAVIRAAWPNREPTWPAFLEGGAGLRITDADADNLLPRALRNASTQWRYRRQNPPPPQPQPPHKRRRRERPRPAGPGDEREGVMRGQYRRTPPPAEPGPLTHIPRSYGAPKGRAPSPAGERTGATSARGGPLPCSPLTADR